jgi:hypothetical protein
MTRAVPPWSAATSRGDTLSRGQDRPLPAAGEKVPEWRMMGREQAPRPLPGLVSGKHRRHSLSFPVSTAAPRRPDLEKNNRNLATVLLQSGYALVLLSGISSTDRP